MDGGGVGYSHNAAFRDTRESVANNVGSSLRNPLETSLLGPPAAASSVRRPVPAVATAGIQRRRVIKKHIQQKYMLCGFVIHVHIHIYTIHAYIYTSR